MAEPELPAAPRLNWPAFFQRAADPIFVLNRRRQVRFVNAAWEQLAGWSAERASDLVCTRKKSRPTHLAAVLAPPPEALAGLPAKVRRPAPGARLGPPWWDISYLPLRGADKLLGLLGRIEVIGTAPPVTSVPAPVYLKQRAAARYSFSLWPADSAAWVRPLAQARLAAQTRASVLLSGPAGCGKLTLARAIHHQGTTAERQFLTVDCRALPPAAVEAVLFGPYGLAQPRRLGSVYLREPGSLPGELQQHLADWLHDAEDAPRFLAGCRNISKLLPELFAAFAVIAIELPALMAQRDDLPYWLSRLPKPARFAPETLQVLQAHDWPGNLRELAEVTTDCHTRVSGRDVEPADLPAGLRLAGKLARTPRHVDEPELPLDRTLEAVERRLIALALQQAGGNRTEAAKRLGIFRNRFLRRLTALGIDAGPDPGEGA